MTSFTSLRTPLARLALALTVLLGVLAGPAAAQDVEVTANAGWVSQYYFRGILQKQSSASAGLDLTAGVLSLGTWAADVGDGSEVDLYGSVGGGTGDFSFSVGGTAYLYTGAFDDTYLEANFNAGAGPLSVEYSIGQYENFGAGSVDYSFLGISAEYEGFYGTLGTFEGWGDFEGTYGEVGYGWSAADLDWSISGLVNDDKISGHHDGSGNPRTGFTLIFGVSKTFNLN